MVTLTRPARPTIILRALSLALTLWTALVPVAASAASTASATVSIERLANGLVTVPVFINGTGPYPFLLDTGAASTVLWDRLALRLGIATAGRHEIETVGGTSEVAIATIAELRLGEERFTDIQVLQMDLTSVRTAAPRVVGIIGQDLLRTRNFLLDYDAERLVFDTNDADGGWTGERIPVEETDGRPMVRASFGDARWRLVLDSGATHAVLFDRGPASLPASLRQVATATMTMTTHDTSRAVMTATVGSLAIGDGAEPTTLRGLVTALIPAIDETARVEDGLLPTSLFRAIYFDNRGGAVILNPVRARTQERLPLSTRQGGVSNKGTSE